MTDKDFDNILQNSLPDTPPDDVVHSVTPWKKATNRIVAGIALTTITINALNLNYLLPFIGVLLMMLGFRALRKENRYFYYGWIVCIFSMFISLFNIWINTTVFQNEFNGHIISKIVIAISTIVPLIRFILLGYGVSEVFKAAGIDNGEIIKAFAVLILWYMVLVLLAVISYNGIILIILMLTAYVFILRALYKLTKTIDKAGYTIRVSSSFMSDKMLIFTVCLISVACIICGYVFFSRHPMDWQKVDTTEQESVQDIKDNLISLGFPKDIANDLDPNDIEGLENATAVLVKSENHPANDGRTVATRSEGNATHYSRVYDKKELCITSIAVRYMKDDNHEVTRIFHHFLWTEDPNFFGTEAIQVRMSDGLIVESNSVLGGRVLCTKDGIDYCSQYYDFDKALPYRNGSDIHVKFSLPRNATNRRGYISYDAFLNQTDLIYSVFYVYYRHQDSPLQFPVVTANEYAPVGMIYYHGPFVTAHDSIWFENKTFTLSQD